MDIEIKNVNVFGLLVKANGRLDLDSAVEYGSKVKNAIEDSNDEITEVILDFGAITFISSFGLKIVLELYKQMKEQNGTLKIINIPDQIKKSFTLVGFDKFIVFE